MKKKYILITFIYFSNCFSIICEINDLATKILTQISQASRDDLDSFVKEVNGCKIDLQKEKKLNDHEYSDLLNEIEKHENSLTELKLKRTKLQPLISESEKIITTLGIKIERILNEIKDLHEGFKYLDEEDLGLTQEEKIAAISERDKLLAQLSKELKSVKQDLGPDAEDLKNYIELRNKIDSAMTEIKKALDQYKNKLKPYEDLERLESVSNELNNKLSELERFGIEFRKPVVEDIDVNLKKHIAHGTLMEADVKVDKDKIAEATEADVKVDKDKIAEATVQVTSKKPSMLKKSSGGIGLKMFADEPTATNRNVQFEFIDPLALTKKSLATNILRGAPSKTSGPAVLNVGYGQRAEYIDIPEQFNTPQYGAEHWIMA